MKNRWRVKFSIMNEMDEGLKWGIDGNIWINAPSDYPFKKIEEVANAILKDRIRCNYTIWQIIRDDGKEYFERLGKEYDW